jgi:putative FmdB family regulatory protein
MPVYEYICPDCRKIVSIFFRSFSAEPDNPSCPECEGPNLKRKISRVVIAKGSKRRFSEFDTDRMMGHYDGWDKGNQAAWARRVAGELGSEGEEFRHMAEKVEAGEEVYDLYDPGPMLEHRIGEKTSDDASSDSGDLS